MAATLSRTLVRVLVLALVATLLALLPAPARAAPHPAQAAQDSLEGPTRTPVERVAGADRIGTAVSASRRFYPYSSTVVPRDRGALPGRARQSPDQGLGWELVPGRYSTALQPTSDHTVAITLPGAQEEVSDLVPRPRSATFVPLSFTQAAYTPRRGTSGQLAPRGNTNLIVLPPNIGDVELVDDGDLNPYEPQGFVYTSFDGTVFTIDADGDIEKVEDTNGNTITITEAGIIHSAGRSVRFTRDALGRITAIEDPEGNRQTYSYDLRGDLASHTDAEGNTTRYRYTGDHDLAEIVDPLGRSAVRYEYDADGRVSAITNGEGRRISFARDLDARQEVVTDADGDATVLEYDTDGNVVRTTDPLGGVTTHTYDADGNQLTTTDPLDRTTTRTFDADGNVLTETDPTGARTTRTYSTLGDVTSETDARDATTSYAYDSRGNLLRRSRAPRPRCR